jgi:hypothetical protein
MEHVNQASEANGVNGPLGIPLEIIDDLQDTAAAESFQRLRRVRLISALCLMQRVADAALDLIGEGLQLSPARSYEQARLDEAMGELHILTMVILP